MTFQRLLRVARSRWQLALAVFSGAMLLAILATVYPAPRYIASAAVVLDVKSPDPIAGVLLPGMTVSTYMGTQIQVIASERVAARAAALAKLGDAPEVQAQWAEAKNTDTRYETWLAGFVRAHLDVVPAKDSNVIRISYWAHDPQLASAVANAIVRAYVETTLDLRVEPARQYNKFFEERVGHLRETLATAQRRLSDFQRSSGIVTTDERFDSETARLNDLTTQLVTMQARASESSRRRNAAFAHSDATPEALVSPIVVTLTNELSVEEGRLNELTQRLGSAHPNVMQTTARIAQLRDKIRQEQGRIAQSANVTHEIDTARLADLRRAVDRQRMALLDLTSYRDRLTVLKQDVESAQRAYDAVYARYNQSEMESQMTQTNVSILENATPPRSPSTPRPLLNLLAGVLFGGIVAAMAVVAREYFDMRLRVSEDVVHGLGQRVLGIMPTTQDGSAGKRLKWLARHPRAALGAR